MRRFLLSAFILLPICLTSLAQSKKDVSFMIVDLPSNVVLINGEAPEQYQCFSPQKDTIVWKDANGSMIVMPTDDYEYIDNENKPRIWYAYVSKRISAREWKEKDPTLFWWLKHNTTSSKGFDYSFDNEFYLFSNQLIIQRRNILSPDEGYEFISSDNGKSFFAKNNDSKPLILITREMLDSIGFNGDSIKLRVVFHYRRNGVKETVQVANSMTIFNLN